MERGLRAKTGVYDDALDISPLDLKGWEVSDIIDFTICTVDTGEIIARWDNHSYKGEDKDENT